MRFLESISNSFTELFKGIDSPAGLLRMLKDYLGFARRRRQEPIDDRNSLKRFLDTRSSYVAQMSLYGYLRTRAGMRYPELFDDDVFVYSINIAKWHIWLACLSDIAVYAGGLLYQRLPEYKGAIHSLIEELVEEILSGVGTPQDTDSEFPDHAQQVKERIKSCAWEQITDDETPFSESPPALVRWAPIVDELKQLDEAIVLNSVRFRWQEIRRDLRRNLNAERVLGVDR